jgi:hypothetical protein
MRTTLSFIVTGKSKNEIEEKLNERLAVYLGVERNKVEEHVDAEVLVFVGEEGLLDLTFSAECTVRIK